MGRVAENHSPYNSFDLGPLDIHEMKLIRNTGNDRVVDDLRRTLLSTSSLDLASPSFSLFAFSELRDLLEKLDRCRVVLPGTHASELGLTGSDADRALRNHL